VSVTQADWPERVARVIAGEVRRYRQERKMSAQQLADRTAQLGMPMPRSVLANLESGRRTTVSAAEVMILSAALDVAPIELLYPAGFESETEVLPGRSVDPLGAVRWFSGEMKLDVSDTATKLRPPVAGEETAAYLLEYHDELIVRLASHESEAAVALARAEGADENARENARREAEYRLRAVEEWRAFIVEPLRRTRDEMRNRGMLVPPLPMSIVLAVEGTADGPTAEEAGGE
jgi:transcriptional regulator with XRE-family HTH domain